MSKWTLEPWTTERELSAFGVAAEVQGKGGVEVHHNGYHIGTWVDNEWDGYCPNANRLVACVNACAGIPTEKLGKVAKAPEMAEAMRKLLLYSECDSGCSDRAAAIQQARALLAEIGE